MAEPEVHTMRKDIERLKKKLSSPVLTRTEPVIEKSEQIIPPQPQEEIQAKMVAPPILEKQPVTTSGKKKPGAPLPEPMESLFVPPKIINPKYQASNSASLKPEIKKRHYWIKIVILIILVIAFLVVLSLRGA